MRNLWVTLSLTATLIMGQIIGLPNQKPEEAQAHCRVYHPHHCTLDEVKKDTVKTIDRYGLSIAHPSLIAVSGYLEFLYQQGNNRWNKLPDDFKASYREYYSFNLDDVRYATDVNTVHGSAITVGNEIYFPANIDLSDREGKRWLLHELEHVRQYRVVGGVSAFLIKYVVQGAIQMGKNGSINIHDNIELEREADSKADRVLNAYNQGKANPAQKSATLPSGLAACSSTYDPRPYRPGTSGWTGRVGQIAFNNGKSSPVQVTLFHPDAPDRAFKSWNVQPGQNLFLGKDNYGMDWGIQVDNSPICILGSVSDWNSFNESQIFQTWVERIRQ